jgi:iron complex outermembrane receptor protein
MEKFYKKSVGLAFAMLIAATMAFAQTTVSGSVKDNAGSALPGANIVIKGSTEGVSTDSYGQFTLKTNQNPPFTLVITAIGYKANEIQVSGPMSGLNIALDESAQELGEIVIKSGREPVSYLKSSITTEVVTLQAIQNASTVDPYDALSQIKGVQTTASGMNFQQINTRGFATIANERFVQWVDGIDTSAPILNFPTGNIVGIGELDMESMELIPGAASALYGPNAFNGILLMSSKNPFDYTGFSAQFKSGVTTSDAQGGKIYPMFNYGFRLAEKKFNDKLAYKINFSIFQAEDWRANDYKTDRLNPESTEDLSGRPDFDGVNLYGDEYALITVPGIAGSFRRTGFKEEDLIDSYSARSIKGDAAIHYMIKGQHGQPGSLEASYNYRFGSGDAIYQGDAKYALRDFTQEFHKLELKGDNFFVRGYLTATDAGNSYNLLALGTFMNETYVPTSAEWAPSYINAYLGYAPGVPAGDHKLARNYADREFLGLDKKSFDYRAGQVRKQFFQRTPPGAKFIDNSRIWHGEFNYNFKEQIDFIEVMVGGNYRVYDLYTGGTILNEDPDADSPFDVNAKRITIGEYGVYTQFGKQLGQLKLTGSIRYDKNENFKGQVTPRLAAVYVLKEENNEVHSIRASFQTGFRNPATQSQFIYFPASDATLLGSTKANAERYGVHNGGAWTRDSFTAFRAAGGTIDANGNVLTGNSALLQPTAVPYVQPEQLKAFEIGYKGRFANSLLIDLNGYYNMYSDFIGTDFVASDHAVVHQGVTRPAGTIFSLYSNSPEDIQSYGVGLGITYKFYKDFTLNSNYNYADFAVDEVEGRVFNAGFNTPNNKFNVGISNNRLIGQNLGFSVNYRWQQEFYWVSSFGEWNVPAFGLVDAQVSYKVPSIGSVIKVGGTNIAGPDYRTNLGGPFVGQQYYVSITFDGNLLK